MLRKEIAIPFNPQTGKEDDTFNPGSKWRPPFSVESVIKLAKSYAAVSDDAKQALMQHAGVTEWDASNPDVVTKRITKSLVAILQHEFLVFLLYM